MSWTHQSQTLLSQNYRPILFFWGGEWLTSHTGQGQSGLAAWTHVSWCLWSTVSHHRVPVVHYKGSRVPVVHYKGSRVPVVHYKGSRVPVVNYIGNSVPVVHYKGSWVPVVHIGSRVSLGIQSQMICCSPMGGPLCCTAVTNRCNLLIMCLGNALLTMVPDIDMEHIDMASEGKLQ
jgi:hypothetical protein